jgi:hypothetical protein
MYMYVFCVHLSLYFSGSFKSWLSYILQNPAFPRNKYSENLLRKIPHIYAIFRILPPFGDI